MQKINGSHHQNNLNVSKSEDIEFGLTIMNWYIWNCWHSYSFAWVYVFHLECLFMKQVTNLLTIYLYTSIVPLLTWLVNVTVYVSCTAFIKENNMYGTVRASILTLILPNTSSCKIILILFSCVQNFKCLLQSLI